MKNSGREEGKEEKEEKEKKTESALTTIEAAEER